MGKIRVGVIGLGRFSERHLRVWMSLPDVEVAAVCSRSPERVEEVASLWGIGGCYTDWNRMLAEASLDAVDVVTADHRHAAPVLAALAAGKHVLVEKPIATTLEDADRMIAAASEMKRILMVGHTLRFDPRYLVVKEAIADGKIGKIGSIYAWRHQSQRNFETYLYGNPLLGLMIHDVDILLWFVGSCVETVHAVARCTLQQGVADTVWAMLRFENGVIGVLEASWLIPDGAPSHLDAGLQVRGNGAAMRVEDPDRGISLWTHERAAHPFSILWGQAHGHLMGPLREELAYFASCVRENERPKVISAQDARNALEVTLMILAEVEGQGITFSKGE